MKTIEQFNSSKLVSNQLRNLYGGRNIETCPDNGADTDSVVEGGDGCTSYYSGGESWEECDTSGCE